MFLLYICIYYIYLSPFFAGMQRKNLVDLRVPAVVWWRLRELLLVFFSLSSFLVPSCDNNASPSHVVYYVRRAKLDSVIMQPSVMEAAARGVYEYRVPSFTHLTPTGVAWDGEEAEADVIIWCTGYRANTSHLSRLGVVREDSTVAMDPRDVGETDVPGVFAVG